MDNKLNEFLSEAIKNAHDDHRIWYDEERDLGYLRVSDKPQIVNRRTVARNGSFVFEYSETGELIGIEFLLEELIEFLTTYVITDE